MTRPDAERIQLSARDEALLVACRWLEARPENFDGADRTRVIVWIRDIERQFGRLKWPPASEISQPYTGELP